MGPSASRLHRGVTSCLPPPTSAAPPAVFPGQPPRVVGGGGGGWGGRSLVSGSLPLRNWGQPLSSVDLGGAEVQRSAGANGRKDVTPPPASIPSPPLPSLAFSYTRGFAYSIRAGEGVRRRRRRRGYTGARMPRPSSGQISHDCHHKSVGKEHAIARANRASFRYDGSQQLVMSGDGCLGAAWTPAVPPRPAAVPVSTYKVKKKLQRWEYFYFFPRR